MGLRRTIDNRMIDALLRRRLVLHARRLEQIRPLPTRPIVTVLEVLAEMIRAEKLLRLVALAEFVHVVQVLGAKVPLRRVGELVAAVAADVGAVDAGLVEGCLGAGEGSAGPGVLSEVEGVLVALGFVFVFEAVGAVGACVLLFGFMQSVVVVSHESESRRQQSRGGSAIDSHPPSECLAHFA